MQRTVDGELKTDATPRADLGLTEPDPSKGVADLDRAALELVDKGMSSITLPKVLNTRKVSKLGTGNPYGRLVSALNNELITWRMEEGSDKPSNDRWKKVKPHVEVLEYLARNIVVSRQEATLDGYIATMMRRPSKDKKGKPLGLGLDDEGGRVIFHDKGYPSALPKAITESKGRATYNAVDLKATYEENKKILSGGDNKFKKPRDFANYVSSCHQNTRQLSHNMPNRLGLDYRSIILATMSLILK